jgi:hypothetical protein
MLDEIKELSDKNMDCQVFFNNQRAPLPVFNKEEEKNFLEKDSDALYKKKKFCSLYLKIVGVR